MNLLYKELLYCYYFGYQYWLKYRFGILQNRFGFEMNDGKIAGAVKRKKVAIVEGTKIVKEVLDKGQPFFMGRFGANELSIMRQVDFGNEEKLELAFKQLCDCAGFFPEDKSYIERYYQIMVDSIKELDILGMWKLPMEDYYMNRYTSKQCIASHINLLDPKTNPYTPWSENLRGKKVLVIHPFVKTIKEQYNKREVLFANPNMLPEFDLLTIKAVQTIAGERDGRFANWFEALDYMKEEIEKKDFDIALIGCGAYGFPLAAEVKKMGKQAIHAGGILQTYFGITGARWDVDPTGRISRYKNQYWSYPVEEEVPQNANMVENGAYWK